MFLETMFWTLVFGFLYVAEAATMGDQCDWTGSGLTWSARGERGVTPVYLRCREGAVSWIYPRGALRLLFKPALPAGERDFHVCIRVLRRDDPPDLFHTPPKSREKAARFPALLFYEGRHKLEPLYAADDGDPRELRCFRSRKGHAALYVEAEPEDGTERRVATLKYETRPLNRRHYDPATADCRPCSDKELELAFCTSDLVSRGTIVRSEERADLDSTQLTLQLTKLMRAIGGDGADARDSLAIEDDDYFRYETDNSLEPTTHRSHRRRRKARGRPLHAHVHVPAVCGASAGEGEFLVMARRRLGKYSLVCAPRAEDWEKLVKRRKGDSDAYCMLEH